MRRHRTGAGAAAVATVAATVVLAGCSIGPQDQPVPVRAPSASTATPTTRAGVPLSVQVYLVRGDRLTRLTRTVPAGAGLEPALTGLVKPLSSIEVEQGLRSALAVTGVALHGRLADGVALIDVPKGFSRLSVREQELAMAQLVFTITADTLASSVQLVQGSRPVSMPDATGQLVDRPVTRLDYAAYRPSS